MIIDEKVIMYPPPPPYLHSSTHPSGPGLSQFPTSNLSTNGKPTLSSLPPHILLEIIYNTFPQDSPCSSSPHPSQAHFRSISGGGGGVSRQNNYNNNIYDDSKPEQQRKVLFWLSTYLRLVSRQLYIACMHVLRSTYLPAYQALIRPPYSSDPFPLGVSTSNGSNDASGPPAYHSSTSIPSILTDPSQNSPLQSLQRETPILDRFIALKVRQDVFADDTELHIEREDAYRDLFDVAQPRARLEDLVRMYGVREGVISVPGQRPRVYAGSGTGSKNSSLLSLQTLPGSPISPTSPSNPTQKPIKTRKSIFSFMKSTPSASSTAPSAYPAPQPQIQPIPSSLLSASFSPRKVGLMYNRSRTIVELSRATTPAQRKNETLEMLAKDAVWQLRLYLEGS